MTRVLERLMIWVADALDRSLLTVPDLDELEAPTQVRLQTIPVIGGRKND
jgi:hypothetical protein